MIAYKFLRAGRVAPFSRTVWPPPGAWLDAEEVELCRSGIYACRPRDLPYWLALGELWRVELEDVVAEERKLVARRGRLVGRVERWDAAAARAFAAGCAVEAHRRAEAAPELARFASDADRRAETSPAITAFIVARMAELQGGAAGYEAERLRQARWLADELGLGDL